MRVSEKPQFMQSTKNGTREEFHRGQQLVLITREMSESVIVVLYQNPVDVEESIHECLARVGAELDIGLYSGPGRLV
jgi:hypothetical protein